MPKKSSSLCFRNSALFHPKTSILIQKRHPYAGNLNSETSGDSKNALLHCGDALVGAQVEPFLVSPLGFNLRERGRRKDLLRQHSQHIKLGLQEEHLPQELQLSYIRYTLLSVSQYYGLSVSQSVSQLVS